MLSMQNENFPAKKDRTGKSEECVLITLSAR